MWSINCCKNDQSSMHDWFLTFSLLGFWVEKRTNFILSSLVYTDIHIVNFQSKYQQKKKFLKSHQTVKTWQWKHYIWGESVTKRGHFSGRPFFCTPFTYLQCWVFSGKNLFFPFQWKKVEKTGRNQKKWKKLEKTKNTIFPKEI